MHWHERFTKARRESCLWFGDADFCSCYFSGVAWNKVVSGLRRRQSADRWKNTKCITCEENHVLRMAAFTVQCSVFYCFNWIRASSILRFAGIKEIRNTVWVNDDIFQDSPFLPCCSKNFWLILFREVDQFSIAPAFEIEYSIGTPSMFVVTD